MIFSVADISILAAFDWQMFTILYGIALMLIAFPQLSRVWPLSSFSFFKERGRWNGVAILIFVSVIAVPHFLMTYLPLHAQKTALASGDFDVIEAVFDGPQPNKQVAWATFPELNLSFAGKQYDVPGSLHGSLKLLPGIKTELNKDEMYRLSVSDSVILKLETAR